MTSDEAAKEAGSTCGASTNGVMPCASAEAGSSSFRGVVNSGSVAVSGSSRRVPSSSTTFTKPAFQFRSEAGKSRGTAWLTGQVVNDVRRDYRPEGDLGAGEFSQAR